VSRPRWLTVLLTWAMVGLVACGTAPVMAPSGSTAVSGVPLLPPPPPTREFRAAWVATVANIDWPSAPGLSAAAQRAEAITILDRARTIGLNALILQVRPAGDALYPSALEPWSEVLSGTQGKAPGLAGEPAFDPLAFWVDEAHKRGLELHAWFNPYRARHSSAKSPLVAPHIGVRRPELVKAYGDQLWMDPTEPAAAAHTLAVVADVVRRYDIDGVHIDDYFYPYPVPVPGAAAAAAAAAGAAAAAAIPPAVAGAAPAPVLPLPDLPFPDDDAYARYRLAGGPLARDDWRRSHVDALVQAMHRTVHEVKAWVRFGVSPFGVGKPALRPPGVIGFSQYDKLYADVERWLQNGWLDYLAPQLYWQINREGLQFPVLLDYWLAQNTAQRHVWPGLFTSQLRNATQAPNPTWTARELVDQVQVQRGRAQAQPLANGHIHFSMVALMQDRDGIATLLQFGPYAEPALVPATPWLDSRPVAAPRVQRHGSRVVITPAAGEPAVRWAVWTRGAGVNASTNASWRLQLLAPQERSINLNGSDAVAVSAVNRVGQLSAPSLLSTP
jgi:uncharacterized lipoprotein YddW (UPF0748 family)